MSTDPSEWIWQSCARAIEKRALREREVQPEPVVSGEPPDDWQDDEIIGDAIQAVVELGGKRKAAERAALLPGAPRGDAGKLVAFILRHM